MHPILFNLGSVTVYSYGAMLSIAFLCGILVAVWLAKGEGIDAEIVLDISLWVMLSAIVGARLAYVIFFWPELEGNILNAFMIQKGGLVFYGGLALALLVILWRSARYKIPLFKLFDIASPCAAIGYSIARIGCFLNGCCYGVECNLPWAVKFPNLPGERHPTQLYASATIFVLFILLMVFWKKRKFDGQIFLFAVIYYSVYRFLIEFIRVNPKYLFDLTSAQWFSILLFVLAVGTLIWKSRKN